MYDDQIMTGRAMDETMEAKKNPDMPVSLFPALEDAMMQMEKLHALINEVYVKAAPLMRSEDAIAEKSVPSMNVPTRQPQYASAAAEKADNLCGSIRHAQSRIARLARELDA